MKQLARFASIPTLLGLLTGLPAPAALFAQAYAPQGFSQRQAGFSQAELEQMLAPIALYPDALLSQLLIATTYWPEVAEAARFSQEHPELSGDDALRVVEGWSWHPSVKSLLVFPQLLAMMGQRPDWVARLGDAFLVQQARVMDTIQVLRQRAQAAGSLQSNALISIVQQGPAMLLLSPDPRVIYAPWYDANLVYGRWWWPSHPPVVWTAWWGPFGPRAYAAGFYPHVVGLPTRLFIGAFDWQRREARMAHAGRAFGFPPTLHNNPLSAAGSASAARGPMVPPVSSFTGAATAPTSARHAVAVASGLADAGRRHHPVAGAGQTLQTPTTAPQAAAALTATRDQFATPRARQPEVAAAAVTQAAAPALPAAGPSQAVATPESGQAPLAGAYRAARHAGVGRQEPRAGAQRVEPAAHSFRTEQAAEIHRMESPGRSHSVERLAMRSGGVQQAQRPQAAVPVVAVAARPAALPAPAPTARPSGNPGDSQRRARGPH